MEFVNYLGQENVLRFMLLFARMSGLVAFFPFFNHLRIPIVVKTSMVLFLTIFLFPHSVLGPIEPNLVALVFGIVMELMLGLMAGLVAYLLFAALDIAGQQISFVMGFTMANVIDPQTGMSAPLMSQILTILAIVIFLAFDGHHLLLLFYHHSLGTIALGGFYPEVSMWSFIEKAVLNMFLLGFIFSFPVKAISLLSDVIFGMLMKTMPQFNLLVVGFPIKIMLSYVVMIAILGSMMLLFKNEMVEAIEAMPSVFY